MSVICLEFINLKYMRKFAEIYPDFQIVQALPAQLPWWHNVLLMERLRDAEERFRTSHGRGKGKSDSIRALLAKSPSDYLSGGKIKTGALYFFSMSRQKEWVWAIFK